MKIAKASADKYGNIVLQNVVRLLTMGLQNNIVTIWAVVDPLSSSGLPVMPVLQFQVKKDDESVSVADCKTYITSFINDIGVWHLFGHENKITPATLQNPMGPDGQRKVQ